MKRKLHVIEESYKRDTELFRTEAMKRDQEIEEEKAKCEIEVQKTRSQVDSAIEFIGSIKKDLMKLMKQVEKKQEQYNTEQTEEENKPPIGNSLLSVAATT